MSSARGRYFVPLSLLILAILLPLAFCVGRAGGLSPIDAGSGLLHVLGIGEGLPGSWQGILELRLWRSLVASAVGASLALAGCYLQGLFRNPLASPSILGVSGASGLFAILAIVLIGGRGPSALVSLARQDLALSVPLAAFLGAMLGTLLVWVIGGAGRGTRVGTLLLAGLALATLYSGLQAAVQSLVLADWDIAVSIVSWTFGNLEDRSAWHAGVILTCLAVGLLSIPFLHRELDLFAFGEADAEGLGVSPRRLKLLVVVVSSILVAGTTAVAGQIAFLGLVAPNLCRLVVGTSHRRLLPSCASFGAVLLLSVDLLRRFLSVDLRPGVLMSLLGAPVFLYLLLRKGREGGSL